MNFLTLSVVLLFVLTHGHHTTSAINMATQTSSTSQDGALTTTETSWSHTFRITGGICYNPQITTSVLYAPSNNGLIFSIGTPPQRIANLACAPSTNCANVANPTPETCQPNVNLGSLFGPGWHSIQPSSLTVTVEMKEMNSSAPSFASCGSSMSLGGHAYYAVSQVTLQCHRAGPSLYIPAHTVVNVPNEIGQFVMATSGDFSYSTTCTSATSCASDFVVVTPKNTICLGGTTQFTAYENGQVMSSGSSFELSMNGVGIAGGLTGGCRGVSVCDANSARRCVHETLTSFGNTTYFHVGARFHSHGTSCLASSNVHANLLIMVHCTLGLATNATSRFSRSGGSSSSDEGGSGDSEEGGVIAAVVILLLLVIGCGCFWYYRTYGAGSTSFGNPGTGHQHRPVDVAETRPTGTTSGGGYDMGPIVPNNDAVMGTTTGNDADRDDLL